jgi:hypothetical protein
VTCAAPGLLDITGAVLVALLIIIAGGLVIGGLLWPTFDQIRRDDAP